MLLLRTFCEGDMGTSVRDRVSISRRAIIIVVLLLLCSMSSSAQGIQRMLKHLPPTLLPMEVKAYLADPQSQHMEAEEDEQNAALTLRYVGESDGAAWTLQAKLFADATTTEPLLLYVLSSVKQAKGLQKRTHPNTTRASEHREERASERYEYTNQLCVFRRTSESLRPCTSEAFGRECMQALQSLQLSWELNKRLNMLTNTNVKKGLLVAAFSGKTFTLAKQQFGVPTLQGSKHSSVPLTVRFEWKGKGFVVANASEER
jgi:hypothetical protein